MLTKKKKQILDYIKKYIKKNDYSPSLEEIGSHFNLFASTIHQHIEELRRDGYLDKLDNRARTIQISKNKKHSALVEIPLAGVIAAGQPIETYENNETITIPKSSIGTGEHFALKVQGDSMIDEGILDGSVVIIKKQNIAQNGDTVVALINGSEVTLKKFYLEGNKIRLQPANPKMRPIIVDPDNILIQGKVVNIQKDFEVENEEKQTEEIIQSDTSKNRNRINLKRCINKVFNKDIMELFKKLPDKSVDMIFGDPDYNVGIKYGDKSYTKNFEEYIDWYIKLTKESLRVLKDDGNLFMINYPKQNAHLRARYLDNLYPFINEYVWVYNTNVGHVPNRFTTAHRTILHVRKMKNNKFYKDNVAIPYQNPTDKRILENLKNGSKGRMPYSWFYFNLVKNVSKEKTYHACQIPQKLTEMLIRACTMPKDIVLILFGGSGSELEICKNLKRKYISTEIDKKYYELILDRLKNGYIKKEYKLKLGKNKKDDITSLSLFNRVE